jgi:hypothetical protein
MEDLFDLKAWQLMFIQAIVAVLALVFSLLWLLGLPKPVPELGNHQPSATQVEVGDEWQQ